MSEQPVGPVILCADGSEVSNAALVAGLAIIDHGADLLVVHVVEANDPSLLTGTGFAGPTMSPAEYDQLSAERDAEADAVLVDVVTSLGLSAARTMVLQGSAGSSICEVAREVGARAIVIGSRGRGAVKRALLGSVSDHVVRNAPCPVIVTSAHGD